MMFSNIIKGIKYGLENNKSMIFLDWFLVSAISLYSLIFSLIWANLINSAISGIKSNNLTFQILLLPFLIYIFLEILKSVFTWLEEFLKNKVFDSIETKVNLDVIAKYANLDVKSLEDPEVNKLFQIIRGPYEWRVRHLIFTVGKLIAAFILLIFSIIVLTKISFLIMFLIFLTSIPAFLINLRFGSISWGLWNADADEQRRFNITKSFLLEKDNLIEAKINNVIPHLIRNVIQKVLDTYHHKRNPTLIKRSISMFFGDLIRIIGVIISMYLLINMTIQGNIEIGSLLLASSAFLSFSTALTNLFSEFTEMYNSGLFFRDFNLFLNLKSSLNSGTISIPKSSTPPQIEFKNVSFHYPNTNRMILKDINLKIAPGMKVALVGENGVGKTTLIKLLAKFYELDSGNIFVNDINLPEIESESWESNIGLLTQQFNTYKAFTLRENIAFGDITKEIDENNIYDSARKANVTTFTSNYPKKFDQLLSIQFTDGIDPSWGQWQRIGIARTFYRNPGIIILDEPTSAIDARAEFEIFENINKETTGKTVIYVSHRYSTVRNADLICVLKDGQIIESGTHNELMTLNKEYAKNFNLQAEGYK